MTAHTESTDTSSRQQLLNVAESLFLSEGVDTVSLRAIARQAGQKNPSALHYHFGNREGLIEAIVARRFGQQETRRAQLLDAAQQEGRLLTLREICAIQVGAPFMLCREDASFRNALGTFGFRLLLSDVNSYSAEFSQGAPSLNTLWGLGSRYLGHLSPAVLDLRIEHTHGTAMLALSRRANARGSFRGRNADLFFNVLVDEITAMLEAPMSESTQQYIGKREV